MLLSEAFELYRRDYIVFKNQSKKTEESHLLAARSLLSFLGDMPIENLEFQHIRDWKENIELKVTSNTSRLYVIKLRNVLKFMRLRGFTCIAEEAVAVPKRNAAVIDFLTPEEVEQMILAIEIGRYAYTKKGWLRNVAVISLLYASGIRVSELCRLNKSDLRIPGSFTVIGKGNKPRLCFYDDRAREAIEAYLESRSDKNQALFICEQNGKRLTPGMVQMVFRTVSKRVGRDINPHMMRHSFATNLLRNNTNLYYVSKFLGHASTQTTEMYLHFVNEDLRDIYSEKHTC